jgi:hypothetical protein
MTITSHGQEFKSYTCPDCGAKSRRPIDIEICQAKHVLRNLLIREAGLSWQKMRGFDLASDPAFKQLGAKRAKKLRGAHAEEMARTRLERFLAKKKKAAGEN